MKRIFSIFLAIILPLTALCESFGPCLFVYKLHGQTRRYTMEFTTTAEGGITVGWGIERNGKWQSGTFTMTADAVANANELSSLQPIDGDHVTLPATETYNMLSRKAFRQLKSDGKFTYNGVEFSKIDTADNSAENHNGLIHVAETVDGSEMWILDNDRFPIVMQMKSNPLNQNWSVAP